jgi:AcrR family transcriptional regulator
MTQPEQAYHRRGLEDELLARAGEIVAAGGVEALSLRELGRSANVSRAAPYHYFPTKAVLLHRLGELGFERLATSIEEAARDATDPVERALAGFGGYLRFAMAEPAILQLMFANRLERRPRGAGEGAADIFPFSSDAAARAFGLLLAGVAAIPAFAAGGPERRLVETNALWAFTHGVAVLAIGDNLKAVGAEALLNSGLRALIDGLAGSRRQTRLNDAPIEVRD